jgi:hypothetical protein
MVFGDFPGTMVWSGVAIIVAAGLYTVQRERSNSSDEKQTPKEAVLLGTEQAE